MAGSQMLSGPGYATPPLHSQISKEELDVHIAQQKAEADRHWRLRILELASKYSSDQVIDVAEQMLAFVNGAAK